MILKISTLTKNNKLRIAVVVFGLLGCAAYFFIDPATSSFFLQCPLKSLTGYECAGCGAQRSFHELLHFRFLKALQLNPLFVFSLSFSLIMVITQYSKKDRLKLSIHRFITSKAFILGILIVVFLFSLLKNTDFYPDMMSKL
ncbi:MAG: DUF2752 domain-containing protein [Weeksellaceae bacterium]|nr:DUF2752 domain-containing protein [Weeksellaceae bacterium]